MDSSLLPALLTALFLALAAGPLGCLILWQRLAYVSDTLGHSALLGAAVALAFGLSATTGITLLSLAFAFLLWQSLKQHKLPPEAILGILSPTALALGILLFEQQGFNHHQMENLLFGDIFAATWHHAAFAGATALIILACLCRFWKSWVLMALHPSLAAAEGVPVQRLRLLQLCLLALFIACALQLGGILLTTALLLIPTATARFLSRAPHSMAFFSGLTGGLCTASGIYLSHHADISPGPVIVLCATLTLLLATTLRLTKP